jgi:hypothetical protein
MGTGGDNQAEFAYLSFDDGILTGHIRGGADFEIALPDVKHLSPDDLLV